MDCKIKPVNTKRNQPWIFIGRTDAETEAFILWPPDAKSWLKELTHWKRPWYWERLKAKGEGGSRGWDGWIASPTQWTRIWANSGRQWRLVEPGKPQSVGPKRVGYDLATEWQDQWCVGKCLTTTSRGGKTPDLSLLISMVIYIYVSPMADFKLPMWCY